MSFEQPDPGLAARMQRAEFTEREAALQIEAEHLAARVRELEDALRRLRDEYPSPVGCRTTALDRYVTRLIGP